MDRQKIVEYFFSRLDNPDFDFSQVRAELERNGVEESEIRSIVRLVDDELQRRLLIKSNRDASNTIIWVGGVITSIGVLITALTYTGIIPTGNSFIIAYGPVLGGLALMLGGRIAKARHKTRRPFAGRSAR
jgi:hypothetical protein